MTAIGDAISNAKSVELYGRFRSYVAVENDVCAFFEREFLAERSWHAAIVSEELSSAEAEMLASACRHFGYESAWALNVNQYQSGFFYKIGLDCGALSMLEDAFVAPSYLVVEEHEHFMLVSDSDYYWEIAGPADFLVRVFGMSAETVNQVFLQTTERYRRSSSRIGRTLDRIASEAIEMVARST